MERLAVFVDAGYFFAAGAEAACGQPTPRKSVSLLAPESMLSDLTSKALQAAGSTNLLRIYWYDAMPGPRPSLEQTTLAHLAGMKLRFGVLNSKGQQKGVDSLIVTDLIDLARNRAISDAVLVSGDEDLRIAVEIAQSFGVRVHIMAAGESAKNVSPDLKMEADSVSELDASWFKTHLVSRAAPQKSLNLNSKTTESDKSLDIDAVAQSVIDGLIVEKDFTDLEKLKSHFESQKNVPPEFDGPLIARVSAAMGGKRLTGDESRHIRGMFVKAVKSIKG